MDIRKFPTPGSIQDIISEQIDKAGLGDYVEYVKYLPADAAPPEDATHVITVASRNGSAKVEVAVKARGFYAQIANAVLSVF